MAKKYVLVVDDDPDLVETVAMMLESKGCEVGRAYLVRVDWTSLPNILDDDLTDELDLSETAPSAVFDGTNGYDRVGFSVAFAGKTRADGLDDLLIGAPDFDVVTATRATLENAGAAYLVFGQPAGLTDGVPLSNVGDPGAGATVAGYRFEGDEAGAESEEKSD